MTDDTSALQLYYVHQSYLNDAIDKRDYLFTRAMAMANFANDEYTKLWVYDASTSSSGTDSDDESYNGVDEKKDNAEHDAEEDGSDADARMPFDLFNGLFLKTVLHAYHGEQDIEGADEIAARVAKRESETVLSAKGIGLNDLLSITSRIALCMVIVDHTGSVDVVGDIVRSIITAFGSWASKQLGKEEDFKVDTLHSQLSNHLWANRALEGYDDEFSYMRRNAATPDVAVTAYEKVLGSLLHSIAGKDDNAVEPTVSQDVIAFVNGALDDIMMDQECTLMAACRIMVGDLISKLAIIPEEDEYSPTSETFLLASRALAISDPKICRETIFAILLTNYAAADVIGPKTMSRSLNLAYEIYRDTANIFQLSKRSDIGPVDQLPNIYIQVQQCIKLIKWNLDPIRVFVGLGREIHPITRQLFGLGPRQMTIPDADFASMERSILLSKRSTSYWESHDPTFDAKLAHKKSSAKRKSKVVAVTTDEVDGAEEDDIASIEPEPAPPQSTLDEELDQASD